MGRSMLFLVSGFVIITGVIQIANNKRASLLPERSASTINEFQARNSSVSLISTAIEKLTIDNDWDGTLSGYNLLPGSASLTLYDVNSDSYPDGITIGAGGWDGYKILLYSVSTYEGTQVITEVLMRRDSFSKYSYFSDLEQSSLVGVGDIYFYSSDVISGPIHTNGTFRMSGTPTFYGHVSSPNMWTSKSLFGDNPDFQSTTDFNAPTRSLPSGIQISSLKTMASTSGLIFTNPIDVTFKSNGSIDISEYNAGISSWDPVQNYTVNQHHGIISSSEKTMVKGVVSGPITLHSEKDIEIMGDIEYNSSPITNPLSTDLLGLVSEENVILDKDAHTYTGTTDVNIHASIMAMGTSFIVENYNSSGYRGNINLFGGIIQKNRGPVGTFGGWFGNTGFSKNYEYDVRLRYSIPPHFPRESVFSILSWKDRVAQIN